MPRLLSVLPLLVQSWKLFFANKLFTTFPFILVFFSFSLFAGSRKYNWQKRRNRQTVPGRGKCFLRFLPSTGMTVNPLQTRLQTLLGRRLPGRHVHGPVSSRNVTCSRYGTPRSFETCRVPRRPRRLQCLCLDKLLLKNCSFPNSLRTP